MIFARETGVALRGTPDPDQTTRPDAWYLDFILAEKPHTSPDYSRPTGFIRDGDNLAFFRRTREPTIRFLETTDADLRRHVEPTGAGQKRNVHQIFIVQWGHVDRHLRQIRKVKAHPDFPTLRTLWTAAERAALLADLQRNRDLIAQETAYLTGAQWNFRESPDRWSIAGILEHLADWEMLMFRQAKIALGSKPAPDPVVPRWTDAQWLAWARDDVRPSKSPPYTEPTGAARGVAYRANFLRLRDLTMRFVETTDADFRRYFEPGGDDVHQLFVITWGHAERHLRQLQRVKAHPAFPKSKLNLSKN